MNVHVENTQADAQPRDRTFPENFLWGVATASHQIEGNNFSSDYWVLEHLQCTNFAEPSGDTCDSWNRWREDIAMVKALGLNTYRFSLEWARIEPERGRFSAAAIDVYRQMCAACREAGILPVLTLHHFTSPRWLAAAGGWETPDTVDHFGRYVEKVVRELGSLAGAFCTMNEPNAQVNSWVMRGERPYPEDNAMIAEATRASGSDRFNAYFMGDSYAVRDACLAAHARAMDIIRTVAPGVPAGMTLALQDILPAPGGEALHGKIFSEARAPFYEAVRNDDFLGVQPYMRLLVGADGYAPAPQDALKNASGNDVSTDVISVAIREAYTHAGVPIIITENGIETTRDEDRITHLRGSVGHLRTCRAEGIPVLGYIHWSLMDNFEWRSGYGPKFGLYSVDRKSFTRTPKSSAAVYRQLVRESGARPVSRL